MPRLRMTTTPVWFAGFLALCLTVAYGQSDATARGQVVRRQGEITASDVYVRSGPSLNHYTTLKLDAGDRVMVVGETGDWFEILPPEGAFSLISGDYVDEASDGARGVVNGDRVRVRAGSLLNDNKYTVQMMLDRGAEVSILGRNPDGFLRIVPPSGATLWISKTFVALAAGGGVAVSDPSATRSEHSGGESPTAPAGAGDAVLEEAGSAGSGSEARLARPSPEEPGVSSAFEGAALTPARRSLDQIDADAHREMAKPMSERRLEPLIERYQAVAGDEGDVLAARYAQERIRQLRDVQSIIQTVRDMRQVSEESESARREFLQQRASIPTVVPPEPSALDAQGTLRESALYPPDREPRRYRLVDEAVTPARTIAYVDVPGDFYRPVEPLLGRRVGIRALARDWQAGGVDPVRIYTVGEFVLLDSTHEGVSTESSDSAPAGGVDDSRKESSAGSDNERGS